MLPDDQFLRQRPPGSLVADLDLYNPPRTVTNIPGRQLKNAPNNYRSQGAREGSIRDRYAMLERQHGAPVCSEGTNRPAAQEGVGQVEERGRAAGQTVACKITKIIPSNTVTGNASTRKTLSAFSDWLSGQPKQESQPSARGQSNCTLSVYLTEL